MNQSHRQNRLPLIKSLILKGFQSTEVWNNKEGWGGRRDLNPRLSVPQTDALPAELLPPPYNSPSLRYFLPMEKCLGKASTGRVFWDKFESDPRSGFVR